MANRLKVPGTLQTRAAIEPSTFDAEKGTVEVCWTTGARGKRNSWDGPYFEELEVTEKAVDLSRMNNGASVLNSHSSYDVRDVIGVVERAWIAGNEGRAKLRFSDREDVKPIRADVANGILRHISVGYAVQKYEMVEKVEDVPVYRATKWTPMELSIVPIAFDDGAKVRGRIESEFHEVEIETRAAPVRQERNMAEEKKIEPAADPVAEAARAAAAARIEDVKVTAATHERIAQEAAAKERDRVSQIRTVVLRHLEGARGEALVDEYVRKNTPIEAVRAAVLDILAGDNADGGSHLRFEAGDDRRDKFLRGAAASIIERAGFTDQLEAAKSNKRVGKYLKDAALDGGEFRGWRLEALARKSLEINGDPMASRLQGEAVVKRALEFRGDAGMNTTSDFTVLLESVVNQVFLGRYATIPVAWPQFCARKSVQDFRATTFYRPGTFGKLDSVTEAGEIKHKNIPDGSKATLTPATKANIIGISRKALVNDRLSVFTDLASGLGEAAAITIEADAWALITTASGLGANAPDGVALFNAAHSNIGTTGAMSVTTLDSMRVLMAKQKDGSGNTYLAARPSMLLVPAELTGTAKMFNNSAADPTDYKNSAVANKVYGLFPGGIVDSPYLSASSTTRVYALADPNVLPVFAVGFIDGREAPEITSQLSFNYDGVQMKVVLDYGTAVLDYRGAVTCAGQ